MKAVEGSWCGRSTTDSCGSTWWWQLGTVQHSQSGREGRAKQAPTSFASSHCGLVSWCVCVLVRVYVCVKTPTGELSCWYVVVSVVCVCRKRTCACVRRAKHNTTFRHVCLCWSVQVGGCFGNVQSADCSCRLFMLQPLQLVCVCAVWLAHAVRVCAGFWAGVKTVCSILSALLSLMNHLCSQPSQPPECCLPSQHSNTTTNPATKLSCAACCAQAALILSPGCAGVEKVTPRCLRCCLIVAQEEAKALACAVLSHWC